MKPILYNATKSKEYSKVKSVPPKRAPSAGDSVAFSSIFLASSFPYSQTLSSPARQQVRKPLVTSSRKRSVARLAYSPGTYYHP